MTEDEIKEWLGWVVFFLFLAGGWGWVANIVALVQAEQMGGMEWVRMAGIIIAPLGAVLGYM